MANELSQVPIYRHTMQRLEEVKRVSPQGVDFWIARDIHLLLGYPAFDKFLPVIERARDAFRANGMEPSHHIAQTSVMMKVGKGAQRRSADFFLSRAACYLITMNGDPTKPEIAGAQAYFAAQTREAELAEKDADDHKRLQARERVKGAIKRVGEIAKDSGVERFGLFHAARWLPMYALPSMAAIREAKGVGADEDLLDRLGSWELSTHDFQIGLASRKILDEGVTGEAAAIALNKEVAESVRQTIIDNIGYGPEKLPAEEPIQDVEKRLAEKRKPKPNRLSSTNG